ncbi:MAG: hypothetical protein ACR2PL_02220 [Dehalococcoidia bacterium]
MVYEQRQQAALNTQIVWLEDELRETKAQVVRLQQSVEQSGGQIGGLTLQVHQTEDAGSALAARLDGLPPFSQQIAHLRESQLQTEDRVAAGNRQIADGLRQGQIDNERLRQELNGTYRRIEMLERAVSGWDGRCEKLEEADRRLQEAVSLIRQRNEEIERRQEAAETHSTRGTETLKRYDHELGRLTGEIETLQKQVTLFGQRTQVFGEMIKRVEEHVDAVAVEVTGQTEIFEKIDLLRAELHRLEDRLSAAELQHEEHRERLDDHRRLVGLLDGKDRGFVERLSNLQEEILSNRAQVGEQFQRLHQALDRQKRRQIEDLERDLRELKLHAFRQPEDG